MNQLSNKTKEIMKKFGIRPNKRLGQNFLIEQDVLDAIVESGNITKEDTVIEIGPGLGTLTDQLCERAGSVIAIELDRRFINILEDVLSKFENYRIIQEDVLKINFKDLIRELDNKGDIKVIANLPYYITTPVIMKLLEEEIGLKSIIVMVQKEVAQRIAASPGGKQYGALTIAVAYYGSPSIILDVPSHSFIPQPEVDSSVIKIDIHESPIIDIKDKETFFKIVRAAFSQRRKTILNALGNSGLFNCSKIELKELLNLVGIDEERRPETLSIFEFAKLANSLNTVS